MERGQGKQRIGRFEAFSGLDWRCKQATLIRVITLQLVQKE